MLKPALNIVLLFLGLYSIAAHATDDYLLKLRIERNDLVVVDTVVEVQSGSSADLRVAANSGVNNRSDDFVRADPNTEASTRIVASVKNMSAAEGDIEVDLQYFEKKDGNWILIGEPAVVASLGQEAYVEFSPMVIEHLKFFIKLEKYDNSISWNTPQGSRLKHLHDISLHRE